MRQFVTWSFFAASLGLFAWSFVPTSWLGRPEQVDTLETPPQVSLESPTASRSSFDEKVVLGPAPSLLSSDKWSVQKPEVATDESEANGDRSSIVIPEEPPAWMTKPAPKTEEKSFAETHPALPRDFKPISSTSSTTLNQGDSGSARTQLASNSAPSGIRSMAKPPQSGIRSTDGWHATNQTADQRATSHTSQDNSRVVNAGWQPSGPRVASSKTDPEIRQAAFYQSQPPTNFGAPPVGGSTLPSFPSGSASPSFGSQPSASGQPGTFPPPAGTTRIDPPTTGLEPRVMPPTGGSGNPATPIVPQNNGALGSSITPITPSMPSYSQPINPQQPNGPRYVTGEPFVSGAPRQWELQYVDYNRANDPCQPNRGAPAGHSVPGVITPPTVTPNQIPAVYSPNNAGYRPLFTLGQENYNVQLGRGLYGQPTAYVPGQNIRNFFRYLFP